MLSVEPKAEADNIFTEILIFPDNTKKESNNSLVILRFGKKKKRKRQENDKHTVTRSLTLLLEITHCARKLQISH